MEAILSVKIRIALLLAIVAATPRAASAQTTAPPSSDELTAKVKPFVDRHVLAGAVLLVADKDKTLSLDAVGYSDVAKQASMRTDALFWVASQTKPITATALMMLADEGKLKLDDPVEKYLAEFKGQWLVAEQDATHQLLKKPAHPPTIREILSHTSGMTPTSAIEKPTLDMLPLRTAVQSHAMTPLQFEPGSHYRYSNAGINTAGRIIEVVSGLSYENFLQTRLFGPLGMKDSTFRPNPEQISRLAKSYKPNADKTGLEVTTITQLKTPYDDPARQPMPAGGLFSTADDLATFCRMILNGGALDGKRYISESTVSEMASRQTPTSFKENYGLGWATGNGTLGHGGAYATNMTIDRDKGLIFIYLVQHAGFPADGAKAQEEFRKAATARFGKPTE